MTKVSVENRIRELEQRVPGNRRFVVCLPLTADTNNFKEISVGVYESLHRTMHSRTIYYTARHLLDNWLRLSCQANDVIHIYKVLSKDECIEIRENLELNF